METTLHLTAAQVEQARAWIGECVWADLDEDGIAELTAEQVERGIARHFGGGIAGFIESEGS